MIVHITRWTFGWDEGGQDCDAWGYLDEDNRISFLDSGNLDIETDFFRWPIDQDVDEVTEVPDDEVPDHVWTALAEWRLSE